jgi:hypothetical protein
MLTTSVVLSLPVKTISGLLPFVVGNVYVVFVFGLEGNVNVVSV